MAGSEKCSDAYHSQTDDIPERDCFQTAATPRNEDEADDSSAVVVGDIVDEVVSFIVGKPLSPLSKSSTDTSHELEDDKKVVEDFVKLMLNGNGFEEPNANLLPVEEGNEEHMGDVYLDELGNYLPPKPSVSSTSKDSSLSNSENQGGFEHQDNTGTTDDSKGTSEADAEDAANVMRLMQVLIDENKRLRAQAGKMRNLLNLVMSKFRNSVTFLLNELDLYKRDYKTIVKALEEKGRNYDPNMEVYNLCIKIAEMKQVMLDAARLDDTSMNLYEERISQLRMENQGLRKIIRIGLDYGGEHLQTYVDQSIQTDDVPGQVNDVDEERFPPTTIEERAESLDVYATSYEYEDDMESFHTATSFNGSTPSLNQEELDGTGGDFTTGELTLADSSLAAKTTMVGDQDKVEFDAEQVNSVLSEATSK